MLPDLCTNYYLNTISSTELLYFQDKQSIKEAQMELVGTKKQLSQYEAEINVLKEQKQALSEKLKDEKAHSSTLEQQKLALQQSLDEVKKKEVLQYLFEEHY